MFFVLFMDLRILSWNATGIMTGIPYLTEELNNRNISICGISEHMLLPRNAHILGRIDKNYHAHTVTSSYVNSLNGQLIGKGGASILWHKSLDNFVETIEVDSDRLVAIKLVLSDVSLVILQVYLPSANHTIEAFKETVDTMIDFCTTYSQSCNILIMGDFNARFDNSTRTRDIYVSNFALQYGLTPITVSNMCTGPDYTFIPYNVSNPTKLITCS